MTTKKLIELLKNPECTDCPHNKFCHEMPSDDPCLLFADAAEALDEFVSAKYEKAVAAAKFVCDSLGQEAYVVDLLDCDECPDIEDESCPMSKGKFSNISAVNACRQKRATVRRIDLDFVDIRFTAAVGDMEIVIDDCYFYSPGEIFKTKEEATAHMESLPPDIQKFYEAVNAPF